MCVCVCVYIDMYTEVFARLSPPSPHLRALGRQGRVRGWLHVYDVLFFLCFRGFLYIFFVFPEVKTLGLKLCTLRKRCQVKQCSGSRV